MGEARQVVDRFYACFAAGDWDGARTCYADDCVTVMPGGGSKPARSSSTTWSSTS